jgi:protein gp37
MGETTKIEWADRTWSPWTGCAHTSPACDGCYARDMMDYRFHRAEWGGPGLGEGTRTLLSEGYWRKPTAWNQEAALARRRITVFPSLCDPFDNAVPQPWRRRFVERMETTPSLLWLLLTKRIGNVRKLTDASRGELPLPPNHAIGATFANQDEWDRDWRKLRDAARWSGAAFTFASFEPMLSGVDMGEWVPDWVIAGGESTQGAHQARPSHPDWFRSLRDQCARAGKAFLFKQWGEWAPARPKPDGTAGRYAIATALTSSTFWPSRVVEIDVYPRQFDLFGGAHVLERVGKRAAGRTLDGVTHDGFPA